MPVFFKGGGGVECHRWHLNWAEWNNACYSFWQFFSSQSSWVIYWITYLSKNIKMVSKIYRLPIFSNEIHKCSVEDTMTLKTEMLLEFVLCGRLFSVSHSWSADSARATAQRSVTYFLPLVHTTGSMVCQLLLLYLLHPNQQLRRCLQSPHWSSLQYPLLSLQVSDLKFCLRQPVMIPILAVSDIKLSILLFRSFHYPSPMLFCSCLVCSSSGVPVPPSGLPSHLHLLPPANARQTSRAEQPEGYFSAVWVQDELVIRQSVLMHCKASAANYYNSINTGKSAFVWFCSLTFILFTCMDRSMHGHRYTPQVHNALCVGRYAVPASLLSHVLGLPEDWLSRLSCSFQW